MKHYLGNLLLIIPALLLFKCQSGRVLQKDCRIQYSLELIGDSESPLIDQHHPGSSGNKKGYEGGTVFMHNGEFHMFVTEEINGWVNTRTGHWKSTDGKDWDRMGTVQTSDPQPYNNPRNAIWSPMPLYNMNENRWNLFYVGYENDEKNVQCCGRVFRAYSTVSGEEGLSGPYIDLSQNVLSYNDAQKDIWEGLQGTDSFFPFPVGKKWYAFYGSSDFKAHWDNGLAVADSLEGKWRRDTVSIPSFSYSENPIVIRLNNGVYFCVFDDLSHGELSHTIGYGYSFDGINWEQRILDIPMPNWAKNIRTPQSLIPINDDNYWVYFTATSVSGYDCVGRIKIKVLKNKV
jgi:hypothetical protein